MATTDIGRIGDLLVSRGKITEHQLGAALRNQGFFREHLGTTLFKMGFIDEDALGEALSELAGVPYARPILFHDLQPSLIGLLPTKLAEKHDVIPLRLEGRKLHVAMLDPRDLLVLDEIAFITGYAIQPWIAAEFRIYEALERYYQVISKRRRTIRLADSPPDAAPGTAPAAPRGQAAPRPVARAAPPRPAAPDTPVRAKAAAPRPGHDIGLDGKPLDALVDIPHPFSIPAPPPPVEVEAAPTFRTLEEAGRFLQRADTRTEVAEAVVGYASAHARRVAIFMHKSDKMIGWDGRGQGVDLGRLKQLHIPLGAPSIFSALQGAGTHYLGGVPDTQANRELFQALGGVPPPFILLVPIVIKGRTAAVFYTDDGGRPLTAQLEDFLKLGRMAALTLEILILRTKIVTMV